ncbi:Hypothetical predicted protein [Paramuricea clavata]|uniref:Uncharacterized protein n=1 Tax=Paramuricea clavata TaxID=317549 RepID=A0A7D9K0M0_PARCT|nr:Hypothetical predicted protein [Paramuricea clavata]
MSYKRLKAEKSNTQGSSISQDLVICGAAYGRADVTEKIRTLRKDKKLSVKASNDVFGDSWYGVKKSLVVVYKYGSNSALLQVVKEGESLEINPPSTAVSNGKNRQHYLSLKAGKAVSRKDKSTLKLNILGAAYGLSDVTSVAQSFVTANQKFDEVASNAVWGDEWPGTKKTLVVVYEYDENFMLDIAVEGDQMHFIASASPPLTILGAAYGLKSVTEKVKALVKNRSLKAIADNDTFEDGWPGIVKTLVIVYQYGEEHPSITVVKENHSFELLYSKGNNFQGSTNPSTLTILGAAYGPKNVTDKVQRLAKNGSTPQVKASNAVFGDPWRGQVKSLVIVYRHGSKAPRMQIAAEHSSISVSICGPQQHVDHTDTWNLLQYDDPTIVNTLTAMGPTIASALSPPGSSSSNEAAVPVEQVKTDANSEDTKSKFRSEIIKQIKDLFELKQLDAITEEEYEEKKKILLKYI